MHKMKPNDIYNSSLLGLLLVFDITLVRLKLQIDLTITKLNSLKSWVSTDWPLCKSITWSNQHCHWFTRWNQLIRIILLSNTRLLVFDVQKSYKLIYLGISKLGWRVDFQLIGHFVNQSHDHINIAIDSQGEINWLVWFFFSQEHSWFF